jgi:ribosomal protein S18 acetylase RimI-like enzyme
VSAGIEIRRIRPEEYAEVGALVRAAYEQDYALGGDYLAEIEDVGGRDARSEVLVAVDAHPAAGDADAPGDAERPGAAQRGPAVLGTITIPLPGERLEPDTAPDEMDVRLLGVAHAARGRGIGAAIMEHCLGIARDRGLVAVALHTGEQMRAPQRLYERMGFSRVPERDFEIDIPGRAQPRLILAYRFALEQPSRAVA